MDYLFSLLRVILHTLQPLLVPLCFVVAWGFMLLLVWSGYTSVRETIRKAKRLHQIPCASCEFLTGDYNLKCTVRPTDALSETAIACPDYSPK
ncbi:hypothetical protein [Myxacorys almedinensis]|uniref:Uncharacterized protein n=1 Tax=Myxacorys almedinensis A TaxID=2690445 RepID=A0A8J8CJA6_9CYAN|nr:hypothetical protein [Myxacorys almedinensis]NDJ18798.1 hypothetical protein [Myxacorys almedinensis A]